MEKSAVTTDSSDVVDAAVAFNDISSDGTNTSSFTTKRVFPDDMEQAFQMLKLRERREREELALRSKAKFLSEYSVTERVRLRQNANSRRLTFVRNNWSGKLAISAARMANSGFISTGYKDNVECVTCGVRINNWLSIDDAYTEHLRWSPKCSFMAASRCGHYCPIHHKIEY